MKTVPVSSLAVTTAVRRSMLTTQLELVTAQKEFATGRLSDPGLILGSRTGQTVSLRQEHARLSTFIDTNALAGARLDATQVELGGIREVAEEFFGALISAPDGPTGALTLRQQATEGFKGLIASLNAAMGGQQLFGGINGDAPPVADYFAAPAATSKQAVDDAFLAAFGMSQADPGVAAIGAAEMQAFLDGGFAAMFDDAQWSANWSAASSQTMHSRISATDVAETSVSANEQGLRKLAMAYTMVVDLGAEGLNESAFAVVTETAAQLVAEGVREITSVQGRVGVAQARIEQVNERMSLQIDILSSEITGLENVDPLEAATRVMDLMTRLEAGYALTARIQRLSLLNFL
ncbi:MAG TPA: flagellar hook-associated family protein [Paracoccaceae bacterium]|nr:flagellar hook-associated family protein [Paracoccaceae bacterium]